jgi:hypothetical protein
MEPEGSLNIKYWYYTFQSKQMTSKHTTHIQKITKGSCIHYLATREEIQKYVLKINILIFYGVLLSWTGMAVHTKHQQTTILTWGSKWVIHFYTSAMYVIIIKGLKSHLQAFCKFYFLATFPGVACHKGLEGLGPTNI